MREKHAIACFSRICYNYIIKQSIKIQQMRNTTKEKILLLLLGGLAFGYSITYKKRWRAMKIVSEEWKRLNEEELKQGIRELCRYDFLDKTANKKGFVNLALTKKGRLRALNIQLENLKNKKEKWDGKWRMIAFDIPEKYKRERDALRQKLKNIGFRELQKSVFITPVSCKKEMTDFIKFFELEKYVRFGILEFMDNEDNLKKYFKLSA